MPPQRRYICSFCARPFSRSEHKARHERSHTKEKPFHCDRCDSCFVRRDLLQRHLRTVHSKEKEELRRKNDTPTVNITYPTIIPPKIMTTTTNSNTTIDSITPNSSLFFKYSESTIISLLTISKKFNNIIQLSSKPSLYFQSWATISNSNLPIIKHDELFNDLDEFIIFGILAMGASDHKNFKDVVKLINKCWQGGIIPLTMVCWIYLNYYDEMKEVEGLIPIEIMMDSLDKLIYEELNDSNEAKFDYWIILEILGGFSFKYNKSSSKSYEIFFKKKLGERYLFEILENLTKNYNNIDLKYSKTIIISLMNELQAIKFNTKSCLDKSSLHNAIIMMNKLMNNSTKSSSNLILISKRNILLNCPLKFQDLIQDYLTIPNSSHHWYLISLTLKEFNYEYNPTSLSTCTSTSSSISIQQINNYLMNLQIPKINNNLGITSLLLLFLGFIQPIDNIGPLVLENHLVLIKLFQSLKSSSDFENPIIQSLIYLLQEIGPITISNPTDIQSIISNIKQNLYNWWIKQGLDSKWCDEVIKEIGINKSPLNSSENSPTLKNSSYPSTTVQSIGTYGFDKVNYSPVLMNRGGGSLGSGGSFIYGNNDGKITLPPIQLIHDRSRIGSFSG